MDKCWTNTLNYEACKKASVEIYMCWFCSDLFDKELLKFHFSPHETKYACERCTQLHQPQAVYDKQEREGRGK